MSREPRGDAVPDIAPQAAPGIPLEPQSAGAAEAGLWIYAGYYAYRALRSVYGQSRLRTGLKLLALSFAYLLVLGVVGVATLAYSAFTL